MHKQTIRPVILPLALALALVPAIAQPQTTATTTRAKPSTVTQPAAKKIEPVSQAVRNAGTPSSTTVTPRVRDVEKPEFNLGFAGLDVPAARVEGGKIKSLSVSAQIRNRGSKRWGFPDSVYFKLEQGRPQARAPNWRSNEVHSTITISLDGTSQPTSRPPASSSIETVFVSNVAGALQPAQVTTLNAVLEHARIERITLHSPLGSVQLRQRRLTSPLNVDTNRYYTLIAVIGSSYDTAQVDDVLGHTFFVDHSGAVTDVETFTFDAAGRVVYGKPTWLRTTW